MRALVGSSLTGFFGTHDVSPAALRSARKRATEIAKASAVVPGKPSPLADVPVVQAEYETPFTEGSARGAALRQGRFAHGRHRRNAGGQRGSPRPGFARRMGHPQVVRVVPGSPRSISIVETGGGFDAPPLARANRIDGRSPVVPGSSRPAGSRSSAAGTSSPMHRGSLTRPPLSSRRTTAPRVR